MIRLQRFILTGKLATKRPKLLPSRRTSVMQAPKTDPNCIFCKIVAGKIPSSKVYETDKTYAFLDVNPLSRGHCLVIPKHHCVKLHELPEEEMADVGPVIVKVAKALGVTDYNILQNNGAPAHQVVEHVHFHIIPKPNQAEGLGVGWPAKQSTPQELAALAEEIKGRL